MVKYGKIQEEQDKKGGKTWKIVRKSWERKSLNIISGKNTEIPRNHLSKEISNVLKSSGDDG